MHAKRTLHFPPFRLDHASRRLTRGDEDVHLEPKAWEVLCCLAERPNHVITKDELLTLVWPDVVVTEGALTRAIGLVRTALDDDARSPRFIETVHRRGFRFIAEIQDAEEPPTATLPPVDDPTFVGRVRELEQLDACLRTARGGQHQIVLVGGEAGIGKTSLVRRFLADVRTAADRTDLWVASGHCVQQHGGGEAYMPLLAALGELGRGPQAGALAAVLREHAPSWLVQLPGLVSREESEIIRRALGGGGSGRMLREIAGALEVLTSRVALVLVLEDLHWSDPATLDFLTGIAAHQGTLRLLVLGLYRPVEAIVHDHPLRRTLRTLTQRPQTTTLHIGALDPEDVSEFCRKRLPDNDLSEATADGLHRRTTGNPLFLVAVIEHLLAGGWLTQSEGRWRLATTLEAIDTVPDSVRLMIEAQIESLSETDQRLLETASVAGVEFALPAVTTALDDTDHDVGERVETDCHRLARHWHLLRHVENRDWPDGTRAPCYAFSHALYQQVLYERVPSTRRKRLHQRIGERLESGHGSRTREIAAELAAHFQESGDHARAVTYLWLAATGLGRRFAAGDVYLVPALHHLSSLPEGVDRDYRELLLRMNLGMGLFAREGFTAAGVEENLVRAEELCDAIEGGGEIAAALFGLWICRLFAGCRTRTHSLVARLEKRAASPPARGVDSPPARGETSPPARGDNTLPLLQIGSKFAAAATSFFEGDFPAVKAHLNAVPPDALLSWGAQENQPKAQIGFSGADPVVAFLGFASWNLWMTGYPDQARSSMDQALALAERSANPFTLGGIRFAAGMLRVFLREPAEIPPLAERLVNQGRDQDFLCWRVGGEILSGWSEIDSGNADAITTRVKEILRDEAMAGVALGACGSLAYTILVDACLASNRLDEGIDAVARALSPGDDKLHGYWDAELYRQQGELLLRKGGASAPGEAAQAFRTAIEVARRQGAKMLELRATVSLCRLLVAQGQSDEARDLLMPVHGWFDEGFDTLDLKEAAQVLAELRG